jgi:hypothetical protein
MPNQINRESLLAQLQSVEAGLSPREIIEQSSCFVFQKQRLFTYNDEVACRRDCDLHIEGAVPALPLVAILGKLVEETLEYEIEGKELVLIGKHRKCGIRLEAEVTLPFNKVEKPGDWRPLSEEFVEAVGLVQHHASQDESQFNMTCIHLHPDHIESCNDLQAIRVRIKTGLKKATLVRRDALRNIVALGMSEFSESEAWLHFRNADGLVLSMRRYMLEYQDLSKVLAVKGSPITLPKGLGEVVEKASIFSAENSEDNLIKVELRSGRMRVKGTGVSGWYQEVKKLVYDGPEMSFYIAPGLLVEITEKQTEAEVAVDRLKVEGPKWTFVTALAPVAAEPAQKDE